VARSASRTALRCRLAGRAFCEDAQRRVVTSRAVYVAIGMTVEGQKEILGLWVEDTEGAKFWMRVLSELRTRGVRDILIACCDGLRGFPAAIEAVFPKTVVQTSIVHQMRNSLSFGPWNQRKKVAAALRMIYTAESEKARCSGSTSSRPNGATPIR
jgi:putative transposase